MRLPGFSGPLSLPSSAPAVRSRRLLTRPSRTKSLFALRSMTMGIDDYFWLHKRDNPKVIDHLEGRERLFGTSPGSGRLAVVHSCSKR